jgi:hypothetical protein
LGFQQPSEVVDARCGVWILRPEGLLYDSQSAPEQRLRLVILACAAVQAGTQAMRGLWEEAGPHMQRAGYGRQALMCSAPSMRPSRESGGGWVLRRALAFQQPCEVVDAPGGVWMLRPQSRLIDGQSASVQRLRLVILACAAVQAGTQAVRGM